MGINPILSSDGQIRLSGRLYCLIRLQVLAFAGWVSGRGSLRLTEMSSRLSALSTAVSLSSLLVGVLLCISKIEINRAHKVKPVKQLFDPENHLDNKQNNERKTDGRIFHHRIPEK